MTLKFNDYALINGHPRGGGGGLILPGDIRGHGPLDLLTFAANFSPGWGIGLLFQFYSRIPEEKTPRICYNVCTSQNWLGKRITREV